MARVRRMPLARTILLLAALLAPGVTRGDVLSFKRGGRLESPISRSGQIVRLELPCGVYEFLEADFETITAEPAPEQVWVRRRAEALAGTLDDRYKAARWALDNGLTAQAVAMIRDAGSPTHRALARMKAALDRLDRPCDDPELGCLSKAAGGKFKVARGPHTILLHQHAEVDSEERIDLLERVVTTFYLDLADRGLELPVPRRRMPSAWFAEKTDYLQFLRDEGAAAFLNTRGWFDPAIGAVVGYDARSDDRQKAARAALATMRRELERVSEAIDSAPAKSRLRVGIAGEAPRVLSPKGAREWLDRWRREANRQEIFLDLDFRALDFGTAAHEMVHLLVAGSGLAPRHDAFPAWLHEGYATQFESFRGARWAGLNQVHGIRLRDWRAIVPPPRLVPLVRDAGFGRGYDRDRYAEAWALVYFLVREHPREFLTYVDLLRAPSVDQGPSADRKQAVFEEAFGRDLDALQAEWHQTLSALPLSPE